MTPERLTKHPFDLKGMKAGDMFLGCTACGFRLNPGEAAQPVCPDCRTAMSCLTVTPEDLNQPPPGIEILPGTDFWLIEGDSHHSVWSKAHGTIVTDPHLFRFLKPYLKDVKVVWDLGACIGDHTRHYLDWGMEVVAFEPNPQAYACLVHNCPEAKCLPYAAAGMDGSLNFTLLENAGASRVSFKGEWSVEGKRLDGLGLPDPDFVKIDVEGFEVEALYGMQEMIRRRSPIIFCEVNEGALNENINSPESLMEFMESLGYDERFAKIYPPSAKLGDPQYDLLFIS